LILIADVEAQTHSLFSSWVIGMIMRSFQLWRYKMEASLRTKHSITSTL